MSKVNWKSKYIKWFRIVESLFGNDVPHLTDEEIEDCVSEKDWIIIPVAGEKSRLDARNAQRPNLYFNLSSKESVEIGVTYDKIESVNRLRDIILPFNVNERNVILGKLAVLPNDFRTRVFKKTKENYWGESPEYEETFCQQSNKMDLTQFEKVFAEVDKINSAREMLDKAKYHLAPAINLVDVNVTADETIFKKTLSFIKPVYEIAVKVKTEEEFAEEVAQKTVGDTKKKQEEFAKYVEQLKEKLSRKEITAEDYRNLIMQYSKSHL